MRRLALFLLLYFGVLVAVPACPPTVVKVVKEKAVVLAAEVLPIAVYAPVIVPAYGVGYQPPAANNGALEAELRALRAELQALRQQAAVPPTPAPAPRPAAVKDSGLRMAKCGACHQQGKEADGGNYVFLDTAGQPIPGALDARHVLEISKRVYKGNMPPKNNKKGITPLTDEEVGEFMDWIDSLKVK